MSPGRPYQRTQYLVDRAYQLRFVTRIFTAVMAVAVISSLIASGLVWSNLSRPELESRPLLIASLAAVSVTLCFELLLAIPIVFILGVRQSHRIVGPMNRIKQALDAIGKGRFTQRITLRQGDALEDLAQAINAMAENLQQRFPSSPS